MNQMKELLNRTKNVMVTVYPDRMVVIGRKGRPILTTSPQKRSFIRNRLLGAGIGQTKVRKMSGVN